MNHVQRIYLTSFNGIDVLDYLIKNARLFYQTWKYWHVPKNHGLATAIAVANDIYKECCEGALCESGKFGPVDSCKFQKILWTPWLSYSPTKIIPLSWWPRTAFIHFYSKEQDINCSLARRKMYRKRKGYSNCPPSIDWRRGWHRRMWRPRQDLLPPWICSPCSKGKRLYMVCTQGKGAWN